MAARRGSTWFVFATREFLQILPRQRGDRMSLVAEAAADNSRSCHVPIITDKKSPPNAQEDSRTVANRQGVSFGGQSEHSTNSDYMLE